MLNLLLVMVSCEMFVEAMLLGGNGFYALFQRVVGP